MSDERRMAANERNWNARTPIHAASAYYARDPESWFAPFEWADLGDVAGLDVVQLQCHLGTETQAFARRGARTSGLDLAGAAIAEARRLAAEAGVVVDYRHGNVYDAVSVLGGGRFDVVYTSKGALCYLPDLARWARVVADLVRPGGFAYVVDFHPVLWSLGLNPEPDEALLVRYDHLEGRGAVERDFVRTYTDGPPLPSDRTHYEWSHGLGELVTSLARAGLRVDLVRETDLLPWPRWSRMVRQESGWYALPPDEPRIPLVYAVKATKPE
ncbi:class I SAM-dependent methyltransferase [Saccharothrix violaceirubra]|uniref:SAM-dependent methyltransferase n=1 Tax=Saccharothrix violaceirubra TaxID=413306 RepID=A0A7W7WXC1_9PSEU|nr:methyltransferase domain-containing protein [Saccharothrix violaceirubra]MBB4966453.1 SAM-dependent methyltransferase [Saccharothrix violaceirubra]